MDAGLAGVDALFIRDGFLEQLCPILAPVHLEELRRFGVSQ